MSFYAQYIVGPGKVSFKNKFGSCEKQKDLTSAAVYGYEIIIWI